MKTVFISSIQGGFADVRDAARKAVESLGMHPLMAETVGASAESPRRALLDLVREADVFLLLLGSRYGCRGLPVCPEQKARYQGQDGSFE